MKPQTRKITVHIPVNLLHNAQDVTGEGITETIKTGLQHIAQAHVYQKLLTLEGTCDLDIDLKTLREDKPINM